MKSTCKLFLGVASCLMNLYIFIFKEFEGNTNNEQKNIVLARPIMARFVRIITLEWHNWTCLRFEFEGCKGSLNY
jgi:hypothetical protein